MHVLRELLHKVGTFLEIILSYPLYCISFLFPRNKRTWVFIGWHRGVRGELFADNTKYLFLYVSNNQLDVRAIWLAKDESLAATLRERGYQAYHENSLRGIWCALRAGTTVIDAYLQRQNFRWSGGSRLVQLLHGKGMKKAGYASPQLRSHQYIFAPSSFVLDLLPDLFTRNSVRHVVGYSRDEVLFTKVPGSDISVDSRTRELLENAVAKGARCILYAPTYRRGQTTLDIESLLNLTVLEKKLDELNAHLFISLHPKYRNQTRTRSSANVHFIEDSDMYPLLPFFNLLITDYSSIFTDMLLLDTPLIFYPYDLESYFANEGVNVDYDSYTPGEKVYSASGLLPAIERALTNDTWDMERARVRAKYHTYLDGSASRRIVDILKDD